jgi:hypothetical protein
MLVLAVLVVVLRIKGTVVVGIILTKEERGEQETRSRYLLHVMEATTSFETYPSHLNETITTITTIENHRNLLYGSKDNNTTARINLDRRHLKREELVIDITTILRKRDTTTTTTIVVHRQR